MWELVRNGRFFKNYGSKGFQLFVLVLVLPVDEVQDAPKGIHIATSVDATAACFENLLNQPRLCVRMCVFVAQLCLTLCNPMDWSLPGSSIHGISQARLLELVAIAFSRGSSQPRDWIQDSCIAGRFFTIWATVVEAIQ